MSQIASKKIQITNDKIFDNFEDDDIWDDYDLEIITPSVFDIMHQKFS